MLRCYINTLNKYKLILRLIKYAINITLGIVCNSINRVATIKHEFIELNTNLLNYTLIYFSIFFVIINNNL